MQIKIKDRRYFMDFKNSQNIKFLEIAVNEYSKISLEPKSLNQFKIDAFERAIRLSKITKNQYAEISNKF